MDMRSGAQQRDATRPYRARDRLAAGTVALALVGGIVLRSAGLGGIPQRVGGVLLGVSGLAFVALALLLMDERPATRRFARADVGAPSGRIALARQEVGGDAATHLNASLRGACTGSDRSAVTRRAPRSGARPATRGRPYSRPRRDRRTVTRS
jgi:hypothetical protein